MADILTDIPGKPGRFWGDNTTFIGPYQPPTWLKRLLDNRWAHNLLASRTLDPLLSEPLAA